MVQFNICGTKCTERSLSYQDLGQKKPDVRPQWRKVKGVTVVSACRRAVKTSHCPNNLSQAEEVPGAPGGLAAI